MPRIWSWIWVKTRNLPGQWSQTVSTTLGFTTYFPSSLELIQIDLEMRAKKGCFGSFERSVSYSVVAIIGLFEIKNWSNSNSKSKYLSNLNHPDCCKHIKTLTHQQRPNSNQNHYHSFAILALLIKADSEKSSLFRPKLVELNAIGCNLQILASTTKKSHLK
jgi:hypothetical protein